MLKKSINLELIHRFQFFFFKNFNFGISNFYSLWILILRNLISEVKIDLFTKLI